MLLRGRRPQRLLDAVGLPDARHPLLDPELDRQRPAIHESDDLAGVHILELAAVRHGSDVGQAEWFGAGRPERLDRAEHLDAIEFGQVDGRRVGVPVDVVMLVYRVELHESGIDERRGRVTAQRGVGDGIDVELTNLDHGREIGVEGAREVGLTDERREEEEMWVPTGYAAVREGR